MLCDDARHRTARHDTATRPVWTLPSDSMYFLKQLKRSGSTISDLLHFHTAVLRVATDLGIRVPSVASWSDGRTDWYTRISAVTRHAHHIFRRQQQRLPDLSSHSWYWHIEGHDRSVDQETIQVAQYLINYFWSTCETLSHNMDTHK